MAISLARAGRDVTPRGPRSWIRHAGLCAPIVAVGSCFVGVSTGKGGAADARAAGSAAVESRVAGSRVAHPAIGAALLETWVAGAEWRVLVEEFADARALSA